MKVKNFVFALVDCNNFYCSCERAFDPSLEKRPVVVLSNNDGCIVARSQEVKDLGVPMAAPYFQYKNLLKRHKVKVFSSNYQLYGDMSARIMNILADFSADVEFYSIDEAFLRLDNMGNINYEEYCQKIRQFIKKSTGIPVSIGIGSTKTLAKIANIVAKKSPAGVFSILNEKLCDEVLKNTEIKNIWGIGSSLAIRFRNVGIDNAYQLKKVDTMWVRKYYTVVGERLVRELNGISCLEITNFKPKKNIISSKSFGKDISDKETLQQSVANYAVRACQKLRSQNSKAQAVYVFIRTNKFRIHEQQINNNAILAFDFPTSDSSKIIKLALKALDRIFIDGYKYHKAGVALLDLVSSTNEQTNFFGQGDDDKRNNLMKIIDDVNKSAGKQAIFFARQGIERAWSLKSQHCSSRYTTNWHELPRVIC